jgi:hypothetical protein
LGKSFSPSGLRIRIRIRIRNNNQNEMRDVVDLHKLLGETGEARLSSMRTLRIVTVTPTGVIGVSTSIAVCCSLDLLLIWIPVWQFRAQMSYESSSVSSSSFPSIPSGSMSSSLSTSPKRCSTKDDVHPALIQWIASKESTQSQEMDLRHREKQLRLRKDEVNQLLQENWAGVSRRQSSPSSHSSRNRSRLLFSGSN